MTTKKHFIFDMLEIFVSFFSSMKGMSLSEHALRTGVIRRGKDKIHEGSPLLVTSEEDIFKHMGLEYRPPHERDY